MMANLVCLVLLLVVAKFSTSFSKSIPEDVTGYEGETYWLVKEATQLIPVQITANNLNELIDPNTEKFVFLAHGWLDNRLSGWYQVVTTSILMRYPTWNVIQVDWKTAASAINYYEAANNSIHVGENVGNTINDIISKCGVNGDKIILVGHSLGAHVVGFAGKTAKSANNLISRIVGLDPAFPPWNDLPCQGRLCKDDAKFLSVMHTDTGTNGILIPIGHADFYPNDGKNQPGCNLVPPMMHGCNHMRALYYFNEGVLFPDHFTSTKCSDYRTYVFTPWLCDKETVHMGDLFSQNEGVFYLRTRAFPPFSIN